MQHAQAIEALKSALLARYGTALARLVVFGSAARGTATAASDIDVLVVLDDPGQPVDWRTERDVSAIAFDVELAHDVVFDLKVVDGASLDGVEGHTPFMENVIRDGVAV